jgi:hypothetical protein
MQGGILKNFFAWGKAKLAYFAGGKNLFTHFLFNTVIFFITVTE